MSKDPLFWPVMIGGLIILAWWGSILISTVRDIGGPMKYRRDQEENERIFKKAQEWELERYRQEVKQGGNARQQGKVHEEDEGRPLQ